MNKSLLMLVGLLLTCYLQADTMEDEGNQLYQAGQWQEAAIRYQALVIRHPENPVFWQRLGNSYLNLQRYSLALEALGSAEPLLPEGRDRNRYYFSKARVFAALNKSEEMLNALKRIADAGGTPYLAVASASEFAPFAQAPEFIAVQKRLRPCQTSNHRAFDFWLGEWAVTSPGREGWQARSSIQLGNDGCSIHETYTTPGGYGGSSVNFYDATQQQWHQTWIDNQGGSLYLVGNVQNGAMVLSDGSNQIIWTPQSDGRVRQHWQVTNDEGKTYSTAFDGYYERLDDLPD